MSRCIVCLVILAALTTGCGLQNSVANCGPQGVQAVHVDNYGGGGRGREVIVCRDGRVFVDG